MFLSLAQVRQFFFEERLCADVLQADRVQHARGGLPKARRRIADHRLPRQAFHHEAAQLAEVDDVFELDPVAEGAAGGDHGILKLNAGDSDAEIGRSGVSEGLSWLASPQGARFVADLELSVEVRWCERFGQYASNGMGGSIDPQQRCECGGQIDRFDVWR